VAAWRPSPAQRRRLRFTTGAVYVLLAAAAAASWGQALPAVPVLLVGAVHLARVGRTSLAAGRTWLASGRQWVRLDRLTQVRAVPGRRGVVHLRDADGRRVGVAVADLARDPGLVAAVRAATSEAERRGTLRLDAYTRACLAPLQRPDGAGP
jgi:hypothetical protein